VAAHRTSASRRFASGKTPTAGEATFAEALEQISSEDEDSAALVLARKKLSATSHLPWEVRRRRTAAVLGRKGYSRDVTMRAITAAHAEESE